MSYGRLRQYYGCDHFWKENAHELCVKVQFENLNAPKCETQMIDVKNYKGDGTARSDLSRRLSALVIPSYQRSKLIYRALFAYLSIRKRFIGVGLVVSVALAVLPFAVLAQTEDEQVDVIAIFHQAQDLHEKGDLTGALKLYDKALKAMPEFPEAQFQRGMAFITLGKPDEAETAYRRAMELRPDWTLAMTGLGALLVNRGKLAEAVSLLQKVLEIEPQNPPAVAAFAEVRLQAKAPLAELESLLSRLVAVTGKANPTPSLWVTRAALENALGKTAASKASLAKALDLDPKNRNALFQLADIAVVENDVVRARDLLTRLEIGFPISDALRLIRANILAIEAKYDEAVVELDAIKISSPPVSALRKSISAIRSTDPATLEKQLADDPRNTVILGRLCSMLRTDDPAKALGYCRKASEAEPDNINHAIGFGAALVQAKQYDAAVGLFRKIVGFAPDNSTARANLATALFQLKRYPEAKEQFSWLTTNNPRSAGAYLFLGIIHDELAEYMDAAANYQLYIKLADPLVNKLDIDKVTLRLPAVEKLIKEGKGKKK